MTTIDSMFQLAIELRDKGELRDSVNVFSKILREYPSYTKIHRVHIVLAGVQSDLGQLDNALINFKKATELNPKSELASLGLYVTLADLHRDEEAIQELFRY